MKAMVVYDSLFGNTEKIAQAIGGALGSPEDIHILRVGNVEPEQLTGLKLLIIGSPTQKFRPTSAISNLIKSVPGNGLKSVKVAAFDTRITMEEIQSSVFILPIMCSGTIGLEVIFITMNSSRKQLNRRLLCYEAGAASNSEGSGCFINSSKTVSSIVSTSISLSAISFNLPLLLAKILRAV